VPVRLLGYARISIGTRDAELQIDALVDAGVDKRDIRADFTGAPRCTERNTDVGGGGCG